MLLELTIRNFAIIRELRVSFGRGFNALTGETGAGKSIIIDALGTVLGARASADLVRTGATSAYVEAVFDLDNVDGPAALPALLEELGIELEGGSLILSRDIGSNGRSTARVNGRTVTAGTLNQLGALLVDIHGQSEHLSLLRPALHLDMLDRYAGTVERRGALAGLVRRHASIQRRIEEIVAGERERAQRIDLLRFQVDEIVSAALRTDEEAALEQERTVLGNAERLARLAAEAYQLLEGGDETSAEPVPGALDNLRLAVDRVDELARVDHSNEALAAQLREIQFLLEDVTQTVRGYAERIEADPARLAEIEERLVVLRQLKRKYGATLDEVIAYGEQARAELEETEHGEERVEELRAEAETLLTQIGTLAVELSDRRRAAAASLESEVERSMRELNMGRTQFVVEFGPHGSGERVQIERDGQRMDMPVDATGIDRVEFLIAPNPGETPRPLARIASGGETARLMLALKSILSHADETPTLVFDEVDVGVGGRSGQPVGEKLWSLGERHQVLVISHLPQVAAFAEAHYRISKQERDGRTETSVDLLDEANRLDELAAMLDGQPVTPASRENARVMLERIERWKQAARSGSPSRAQVSASERVA